MKRHSFFLRLFVGNLVIVVLAVGAAALLAYRAFQRQYAEVASAYQENLCRLVARHLETVWPLAPAEVDRLCKGFLVRPVEGDGEAAEAAVRLTVVAADGTVLGDSRADPAEMANHRTPDRPEVLAALDGRPGTDLRRSETLGTAFRYVAHPVRHGGRVVAAARVAVPVSVVLRTQALAWEGVMWGGAVAVFVFVLLGLLINWIWSAPLRRLSETARRIASGDLESRVEIGGPAELAELGAALEAMRGNLARQVAAVSAEHENLQRVVANLREGVVATDPDGRITLINREARRLLGHGLDEVVGRPIGEVVRLAEIVDLFRQAMETGHPAARQVETESGEGPRYLDVQASRLATPTGGLVGGLVVVRDVTDLVRTAAMKAEFVANASHELRTPLATLRMAVESLEDEARACGAAEALAETVDILKRHVDRLERLTLDLLDLHAVETAKRRERLDRIPVASVVEWLRREFGPRAERKGLAFEVRAEGAGEAFTSDRQLLELILQNLLENSLKFTEPGGRVVCSIGRDGREMVFRVTDTGCGIAPTDQPRIFERFYQAEASRSGDTKFRGTGLGLAIVKHAVGRLGGEVGLTSQPGKGTEVTVRVPDRSEVAEAEEAP